MGAPARLAWCLALGAPLAAGTLSQPAQALRQATELHGGPFTTASVPALLRGTPGFLQRGTAVLPGLALPDSGARSPWQESISSGPLGQGAGFAYSLNGSGARPASGRGGAADLSADGLIEALLDAGPPLTPGGLPESTAQKTAAGRPPLQAAAAVPASRVLSDQRSIQEQFLTSEVNEFMTAAVDQPGMARQCLDRATYHCGSAVGGGRPEAPVTLNWKPSAIDQLKQQR